MVLVLVLALAAGVATGWIVPADSVAGMAWCEHCLQYCFFARLGQSTGFERQGLCLGLAAGSSVGGAEATAAILVLLEAAGGPRGAEAKSAILA